MGELKHEGKCHWSYFHRFHSDSFNFDGRYYLNDNIFYFKAFSALSYEDEGIENEEKDQQKEDIYIPWYYSLDEARQAYYHYQMQKE